MKSSQPEDPPNTVAADRLAESPPDSPNDVTVPDNSLIVRLVGPVFALFSVILVPWVIYLAMTLPQRQVSSHYDIAWVGFDAMECLALASTAYFALRRSMFLATAATVTATLLMVDAWFDTMTTPERDVLQPILLSLLVELPLAALCVWLSYHTIHIVERQIILLRWKRPRLPGWSRRASRRPPAPAAEASRGEP